MPPHCELPSVVFPRVGATREVVHASLGYEQSKLISSHSTLASIQHVGVRPIVLLAECDGNSYALGWGRHPMMMMMMIMMMMRQTICG